jgi:hypothetical protein
MAPGNRDGRSTKWTLCNLHLLLQISMVPTTRLVDATRRVTPGTSLYTTLSYLHTHILRDTLPTFVVLLGHRTVDLFCTYVDVTINFWHHGLECPIFKVSFKSTSHYQSRIVYDRSRREI